MLYVQSDEQQLSVDITENGIILAGKKHNVAAAGDAR